MYSNLKKTQKPPKSPRNSKNLREQDWDDLNSNPQVQRRKKGPLALLIFIIHCMEYSSLVQYSMIIDSSLESKPKSGSRLI